MDIMSHNITSHPLRTLKIQFQISLRQSLIQRVSHHISSGFNLCDRLMITPLLWPGTGRLAKFTSLLQIER